MLITEDHDNGHQLENKGASSWADSQVFVSDIENILENGINSVKNIDPNKCD